MYLLNNDKLKDRNTFWTWLFFNKKLKEDCKESITLLLTKGEGLDLKKTTLVIDGKNKKIKE